MSKSAIEPKKEYGLCLGQGTMQPDPSCQNCSSTQSQQNQFSFQNDKSSFCHIRTASHKSNTYSRMRASRNMHYRFLGNSSKCYTQNLTAISLFAFPPLLCFCFALPHGPIDKYFLSNQSRKLIFQLNKCFQIQIQISIFAF